MGAAFSHSSPSPPSSCGLAETQSTTRLFTVTDYSRWARMPPGTALNFGSVYSDEGYRLKVYPAGFDRDSADFVAVFVGGPFYDDPIWRRGPARFSVEILDASRKHTVFDNSTARSEQTLRDNKRSNGYVRFVNRREMEASCCVREDDDSLTIRCTLSIDREVTRLLMFAPLPPAEAVDGGETAVGSRTVTIGSFSRFRAALRTGECAYTPHFALGGSSWYLKLYPNGHCDDTKDCVAVFLGRGKSDEPATKAEFRFELAVDSGLAEEGAGKEVEFTEHTFDRDTAVHVSPYLVTSSDLASAEQMVSHDCLVVRCHLRVIKVSKPSLVLAAMAPPTVTTDPPFCDGVGKNPGVVADTEEEETSGHRPNSFVSRPAPPVTNHNHTYLGSPIAGR